MMSFEIGDRVQVRPEHDIPEMFRPDGRPTAGEVREIEGNVFMVWVSIGGAGIDEHSQAVPYTADQLELVAG
jgi:vacuolar-type H+-ATPase subunit B/Vma2